MTAPLATAPHAPKSDLIILRDVLSLLASAGIRTTRRQVYQLAAAGDFPAPAVSMGPRRNYWRRADLDAFLRGAMPLPSPVAGQEG